MDDPFTPEDIEKLSAAIDAELRELGAPGTALSRGRTIKEALGEKQKVVSLKLADGEIVRGWIEYYDKNMVRLTRDDGPNLFIFKHEIMYIAEDGKKK